MLIVTAAAGWRPNEIDIAGARRGPKLEAPSSEPGWGSWGGAPHQLRGLGERCKRSPGRQEFWCIWGSSGELSCSPAIDLDIIHSRFCDSARKFSGWLAGSSRKIWLLWLERRVKQYTSELRMRILNE